MAIDIYTNETPVGLLAGDGRAEIAKYVKSGGKYTMQNKVTGEFYPSTHLFATFKELSNTIIKAIK